MAEDKGKVSRPEASKKARDLKKMKLTAKDYKEIEEVLKAMEARENEYQKHYRINNIEEKNPAYMDPEELKEWIKVRTKVRKPKPYPSLQQLNICSLESLYLEAFLLSRLIPQ